MVSRSTYQKVGPAVEYLFRAQAARLLRILSRDPGIWVQLDETNCARFGCEVARHFQIVSHPKILILNLISPNPFPLILNPNTRNFLPAWSTVVM